MPVIGFHSTIDKPESVKRVQPPTSIKLIRDTNNVQSQILSQVFFLSQESSIGATCVMLELSSISSNNFLFLVIYLILTHVQTIN